MGPPPRLRLLALALAVTLGCGTAACGTANAEVVDRMIAEVNGHPVMWSDLDEQMRFEALENERALKDLTAAQRREAFDHLEQNWILRDQMQGMFPAADSDVDARIAELRAGWHMENDPARWDATLQAYEISPEELHMLVANQLEILRFVEFRVRPLVRVSRQEVEDYYNRTLVPQVEAQGQTPEPIAKLRSRIRDLLTEQKVNQEMEKWMQSLLAQSQVELLWDGVR